MFMLRALAVKAAAAIAVHFVLDAQVRASERGAKAAATATTTTTATAIADLFAVVAGFRCRNNMRARRARAP